MWQSTVEKKRAVRASPMRFGTHSYQNPFIVYLQFKFDWLSCILSGILSLRLEELEWWPGGCHELGEDKSISIDLRGRQSS